MNFKNKVIKTVAAAFIALPFVAAIYSGNAIAQGKNGTTLAASKTLDICSVDNATWRYSGEISVWNEGAIDTIGLNIVDKIQNKTGSTWIDTYPALNVATGFIQAGTTLSTATTFPYSIDAAPLSGDIRNVATITITNHSGSIGTPKGPEPKATFTGQVMPCATTGGCSYTQGYWGNKPGVVWPAPYARTATFYLSGQTWQQVMDANNGDSPKYYGLAHQYIAAVLNQANGALVPLGVQTTLSLAAAWLGANPPGACTANGSCGLQTTWAGILDDYNNGRYPNGPAHCGDE